MEVDVSTIEERLAEQNMAMPTPSIVAYRVEWDEDFDEWVVWVMHALDEPDGETWPLTETDARCSAASGALRDIVGFTYCDFRTHREAKVALKKETALGWVTLRTEAGSGRAAR